MAKVAVLMLVAVLGAYAFHTLAQGRADVRQAITPVGTSSSNGISFVWFYESTSRAVYFCRAGQGGGEVECKAGTSLP